DAERAFNPSPGEVGESRCRTHRTHSLNRVEIPSQVLSRKCQHRPVPQVERIGHCTNCHEPLATQQPSGQSLVLTVRPDHHAGSDDRHKCCNTWVGCRGSQRQGWYQDAHNSNQPGGCSESWARRFLPREKCYEASDEKFPPTSG